MFWSSPRSSAASTIQTKGSICWLWTGDGKLAIIELKRDDSGTDAHWQAIKYASYLHGASNDDISDMFAKYGEFSVEDAEAKLREHLRADDLNG